MVGRFVEHQQVRLHDEEPGEVGAHHPATGIFTSGFVEILGFKAKAVEDFLGLGLELVAIKGGELVLGLGEFWAGEVTRFFALTDDPEQTDHFRGDAHGDFKDRLVRRFARFLGEVAGDGVFVALDGAFVGGVLVEDHAEEGRLASAVRSDEGDAFAPVDGHFRLAEQGAAAESLGKLVNGEHGRGLEQE